MTGQSDWTGSIQDDFSIMDRADFSNYSVTFYHPWGSPSVSAAVSILYSVWITVANVTLMTILLTSPRFVNSRPNMIILHLAVVDLTVGLFYCPLTADFYIRGQWIHGCDSFFVWFIFLYPQVFLSIHLMGLLNAMRLLSSCFPLAVGRWLKNVLFVTALVLLWFYVIMIGGVLEGSRSDNLKISVGADRMCRALIASNNAVMVNMLVYFIPAVVTVVLMVANVVREKTTQPIPRTQLQLECETEQSCRTPLCVLSLATLITCLMPFSTFVITTTLATGGCTALSCLSWVIPLSTVSEWVLFAKSGFLPLIWLLSPDFRMVLLGALHHFRRVPTSDTRDLVDGEIRGDTDDAPFSDM